jgi:endonuclease/exonuclease/phosphatase family metal-dependent hydrolase
MAKVFVRKVSKYFFIGLTVLVVLLFLLACLTPYLNPKTWWLIGFIGLTVPYLIALLILLILFWLMAKPKVAWVPIITLLLGLQQISVFLSLHIGDDFVQTKDSASLRVITWNVQSFNGLSKNRDAKKLVRNEMVESIHKLQADVVCLQEFNTASAEQANNLALFSKNYPYHFFSQDYTRSKGQYFSGCIIFSKYPIVGSNRMTYPVAESLIYADVIKGTDTIRVYTTHLQSFKFKKEDYEGLDNMGNTDEATMNAKMNVFKKMKLAFKRRGVQADMVRKEIDKSPYPSIICGDFNDVPNSYTYFHIKGDRQDAFLKEKFGIGRTYIWLSPTLRIDYLLPDKNFEVKQFELVDEDLSDHLMLVCDVKLKNQAQ